MVMLVSFPPILTSAPSHMGECNFYHICSKNSPQKSYTDQKERKQTTREELSLKLFSIRLRFSVKQKIIANITLKRVRTSPLCLRFWSIFTADIWKNVWPARCSMHKKFTLVFQWYSGIAFIAGACVCVLRDRARIHIDKQASSSVGWWCGISTSHPNMDSPQKQYLQDSNACSSEIVVAPLVC